MDPDTLQGNVNQLLAQQQFNSHRLERIEREIENLRGLVWKLLLVAAGGSAAGTGITKLLLQ